MKLSSDVKIWVQRLNAVLLRGQVRVHQGKIYYRSSYFPVKTGEAGQFRRYDCPTRVSVSTLAGNKAGMVEVQAQIVEWDRLLFRQEWVWVKKTEQAPLKTVAEWISEYENWYWSNKEKTVHREKNFKSNHLTYLRWIEPWMAENQQKLLTEDVLLGVLQARTKVESRQRESASIVFGMFAGVVGINDEEIRRVGKGWKASMLTPRDLPSVAEIMAGYKALSEVPEVQAGYALLVLYGIRPHELPYCQPLGVAEDKPWIHVSEGKTGSRDAYELRVPGLDMPGWDGRLPRIKTEGRSHRDIGSSVGSLYQRYGIGHLYNLRHHYAAMGFALGKPIDRMAMSMGHSESVHSKTYRAWVSRDNFQQSW